MKIITQTSTTDQSGQVTSTGTGGAVDPLDLLARQAQAQETADNAALNPGGQDGQAQAGVPAAMGNAQCLSMVMEAVREMLTSMAGVKSPAHTLSDEKIAPAAAALAAVFDKRGIQLAGVAGNYVEELKALAVAGPVLWGFGRALAQEVEADKKRRATEKTGLNHAPGEAEPLPNLTPEAGFVHVVG